MQGINNFCREIGITRTGGELPLHILDYHVRADLHLTSPRTLALLHPLKVVITNLPEDHYEMVDAKASPVDCAQLGDHDTMCLNVFVLNQAKAPPVSM